MDDVAKKLAVKLVLRDWRVRLSVIKHDEDRIGRIADTVWKCCEEMLKDDKQITSTDYFMVQNCCLIKVQQREDYADTVSFISPWVLAIILKVIISILIDFWLEYKR